MRSFITVQALLCLIIGVSVIRSVDSACGVCSATTSVVCVSESQFYFCSNGIPDITTVFNCPAGTVCDADNLATCVSGGVPDCVTCGACSADGVFACQTMTMFSLCNEGVPGNFAYSCPINQVCNINGVSPNYCTVDDGTILTCSPPPATTSTTTTTTTTTTTEPTTTTISPTNWCLQKGTVGRYPLASDTLCKSYYYCYLSGGTINGAVYTCEGTTVFRPDFQQCVASTSYVCPTQAPIL